MQHAPLDRRLLIEQGPGLARRDHERARRLQGRHRGRRRPAGDERDLAEEIRLAARRELLPVLLDLERALDDDEELRPGVPWRMSVLPAGKSISSAICAICPSSFFEQPENSVTCLSNSTQVSAGSAVYAYPQDAGPMIQMCNTDVLTQGGMTAAPTTWDEFAKGRDGLPHRGTRPGTSPTSPPTRVGGSACCGSRRGAVHGRWHQHHDQLHLTRGHPSCQRLGRHARRPAPSRPSTPIPANGRPPSATGPSRAGRPARGAPRSSSPRRPSSRQVAGLPHAAMGRRQRRSTATTVARPIAVMKASQHPQEAATFNAWLNTDPGPDARARQRRLRACSRSPTTPLANPAWADFTAPFWGGQKLHS